MRAALEGSLKRLGTDYVDHYQLHRPDPKTPVSETLGALAELKAEGKIREIGCSNFGAEQLVESSDVATEQRDGRVFVGAEPLQPAHHRS